MPQDATNKLPPEMLQVLTEQLRGVHTPDAISWWPLAWGWWVLLIIILCSVTALLWKIKSSIAKNRYRTLAVIELKSALAKWTNSPDNSTYLQTVNATLKRVVLQVSEQPLLATISGQPWIELLNQWVEKPLSQKSQDALAIECYQANGQTDINAVHNELLQWLKKHKPQQDKPTETNTKRGQHA